MRRWIIPCLAMWSLVCVAARAEAAEFCEHGLGRKLACAECAAIPRWCPDDYCRKPFPCIPCVPWPNLADDYCPKPLVCLPGFCIRWCADDYCPKPFPQSCHPAHAQLYRCPPGDDSAAHPRAY